MTSFVMPLWAASWFVASLNLILLLASIWLILLVLIQRGKGGGLAGAFGGGGGGGSVFGSRAGDTFTKITIYSAIAWIFVIMIIDKWTHDGLPPLPSNRGGVESTDPTGDGSQE